MEESKQSPLLEALSLEDCLDPGAYKFMAELKVCIKNNKAYTQTLPNDRAILFYVGKAVVIYQRLLNSGEVEASDSLDISQYLSLLVNSKST